MIFASWPLDEAEGLILAHAVSLPGQRFKKGRVLSAPDVAALRAAGHAAVIGARLEPSDCPEDVAALRVAKAAAGPGITITEPFTGRVNLIADAPGLVILDASRVEALNLLDEAVTIATLPPHDAVEARQMLATVKIIPFAAPEHAVAEAERIAIGTGEPLIRLAPFQPLRAGLIQTELPTVKASVLDKTERILADRLRALGGTLEGFARCPHRQQPLAEAIRAQLDAGLSPVLVAGASAITDRRDVIPAAIEALGGVVEHFGMPVDPGNLMLLGRVGSVPVIGLPGCARSPKLNGFDWVLQRIAAGLRIGPGDIMRMGVGGLLKEIATRPQPREGGDGPVGDTGAQRAPRIGAILLAAGQSRRMGGQNKLLRDMDGAPLAARALSTLLQAGLETPVVAVTGHAAGAVGEALLGSAGDAALRLVHNPDYAAGLSTSLAAGLAATEPGWDGVIVMLADMPGVTPRALRRLIAAFNPVEGRSIVVPTFQGKRGNPVLWAARYWPAMRALSGDSGAKHLIGDHADQVAEVEMDDPGVLVDLDTPEAWAAYSAVDSGS